MTHRRHAIIETVFADLIDGPLAHIPSRRFSANSALVLRGAIAHNLSRAAGALAGGNLTKARGAALRRKTKWWARRRRTHHTPTGIGGSRLR